MIEDRLQQIQIQHINNDYLPLKRLENESNKKNESYKCIYQLHRIHLNVHIMIDPKIQIEPKLNS
jgi:hypothetical protein